MPPIITLLERLQRDFKVYTFTEGSRFMWSARKATITYPALSEQSDMWSLLHEIAHAELTHTLFKTDIELIAREAQAWQYAKDALAPRYGVVIDDAHIEDHLDTYRHWLHARSRCPACRQNGFQTTQNTYNCVNCRCSWRVNGARDCRLRRVKLQVRSHSAA